MSRIFEALQRAEAELAGREPLPQSGATELLQRVERQATSKMEVEARAEDSEATETAEIESPFGVLPTLRAAVTGKVQASDDFSATHENLDVFSLFQSQQIHPPAQGRLITMTDLESPAAEAFRLLGVRLRHLRRNRPLRKVLITSTIPQEGKSMVSANLACTLASRTEQRVLLIEGDVRRPSLSKAFGLGSNLGLCEYLTGERNLVMSIYHIEGQSLWILPAGVPPVNPLKLLQSRRLGTLMDQVSQWFDWIIIDTPPVLPLADTSVWMRYVDGVLLVTRQGTTMKRQLQKGLEAIEPKKIIGAVMNASRNSDSTEYYYRQPRTGQTTEPTTRDL